jgi:hypothetical protein
MYLHVGPHDACRAPSVHTESKARAAIRTAIVPGGMLVAAMLTEASGDRSGNWYAHRNSRRLYHSPADLLANVSILLLSKRLPASTFVVAGRTDGEIVNISKTEQFIEPQVSLRGQRIVPAGHQPERMPMCLNSLMVTRHTALRQTDAMARSHCRRETAFHPTSQPTRPPEPTRPNGKKCHYHSRPAPATHTQVANHRPAYFAARLRRSAEHFL